MILSRERSDQGQVRGLPIGGSAQGNCPHIPLPPQPQSFWTGKKQFFWRPAPRSRQNVKTRRLSVYRAMSLDASCRLNEKGPRSQIGRGRPAERCPRCGR